MHSYKDKKSLPYPAELVNNIILDIEKYPEFLPWCAGARILSRNSDEIIAELTINFKAYSEKYTSRVTASKNNDLFKINVEAISGPFRKMINLWEIKKTAPGCEVHFSIDFAFKSGILNSIAGAFFLSAGGKMVGAFEARARSLSKDTVL